MVTDLNHTYLRVATVLDSRSFCMQPDKMEILRWHAGGSYVFLCTSHNAHWLALFRFISLSFSVTNLFVISRLDHGFSSLPS